MRRRLSFFLISTLTFLLVLQFSFPWVIAQEERKPKPKDWHISGIVAALDDSYPEVQGLALRNLAGYEAKDLKVVLKRPKEVAEQAAKLLKDKEVDGYILGSAAEALGNLGDAAQPYVKDIANVLKDKEVDGYIRGSAAEALSNLGDAAQPYVRDIANVLKDETADNEVRAGAAEALGNLGNVAQPYVKDIADILKDETADSGLRVTTAYVLVNSGKMAKPYVQDIFDILKDETADTDLHINALQALRNLEDVAKPYVQDIFDIVKDETFDSLVRSSAIETLGYLGNAAENYAQDIVAILKDENVSMSVRKGAASALGKLGDAAKPYVQDIFDIVKDRTIDINIIRSATGALEDLGDASKPYVQDIFDILKDKTFDEQVRESLALILMNTRKLELQESLIVLDSIHYDGSISIPYWRFKTYFLSGGTKEVKNLLQWIGKPKTTPEKLTHSEGVKTLKLFLKAWEAIKDEDLTELQKDLAQHITEVAAYKKVSWQTKDIPLLQKHYKNLNAAKSTRADKIQSIITKLQSKQTFFNILKIILIHAAFWLALIFAYPKSPQVQAIFFWNPWVRRISGMVYVGFLLTWVPFLRRRLFEPFQPSLLADAGLDNFDEQGYFGSSRVVKSGQSQQTLAMSEAIPNIKGQTVLIGESGLGKSMFLRCLAKNSKQTLVYLPASKCEQGVIKAIQAKLHGQAKDAQFLKNLIYSGAIDICIDGLNEVTADTRSEIKKFVESYFRGDIIMTTQPLEWEPPTTAKIFYLQPLESRQIKEFLFSRQQDDSVGKEEYQEACQDYLKQALHSQQTPEELAAIKRVLSNPMDLTLVAQMLSQGEKPDLFHLQQQQYQLMAEEYKKEWGHTFPLKKFSSSVYEMRLNDETTLDAETFDQELQSLEDEKYKMVISRQWQGIGGEPKKEWYFRHDKIMDFFLVQNFLGDSEERQTRLKEHIGDPRFRGVYFLLANLLEPDAAYQLRENLIQYAADTNDHTVSDNFVKLLRSNQTQLVK